MSLEQLFREAQAIAGNAEQEGNAALARDDVREAKRVLTNAARELRDVKRRMSDEQRLVRESYADARLNTAKSGQTVGLFVNSKTRGAMARGRAVQQRKIRGQQQDAMSAFGDAKAQVDSWIARLTQAKAELDRPSPGVANRTSSSQPPPPPASPPPAGWHPDPMGRHQHRYWDGDRWTEHVADHGVTTRDTP